MANGLGIRLEGRDDCTVHSSHTFLRDHLVLNFTCVNFVQGRQMLVIKINIKEFLLIGAWAR